MTSVLEGVDDICFVGRRAELQIERKNPLKGDADEFVLLVEGCEDKTSGIPANSKLVLVMNGSCGKRRAHSKYLGSATSAVLFI